MKKAGVNVLIFNLLLSIIAISFNMGFVSGIAPTINGLYNGQSITSDNTIYEWSSSLSEWVAVGSADSSTTTTKSTSGNVNIGREYTLGETPKKTTPSSSPTPSSSGYTLSDEEIKTFDFGKFDKAASSDKSGDAKTTPDKETNFFSNIMQSFTWAGAVYAGVQTVGSILGWEKNQVSAASIALASGTFVGTTINSLWGKGGTFTAEGSAGLNPLYSAGIGLAVSAVVYYYLYKDTSEKIVTFECKNWDAPTGGDDCEKCNAQDGGLPCSEYQCRSLGQSCQLLNDGEVNGSELSELKCVWVNRNDVEYPIITPWEGALTTGYSYSPDNSISPPDKGVKIIDKSSKDGCVKPFSPISFGVLVDEPAKCKVDYTRKEKFEDMSYFMGGNSLFRYNHTHSISLPDRSAFEVENLTVPFDGDYELYIRCQDANGNYNPAHFVFKFCVGEGPDTTAPLIVSTNLLNGMPIAFNQSSIDLELYVNEPAECRWSHRDQIFDKMEESFTCSSSIFEMNAQMLYTCQTTLTGLKNEVENKFYFRCKDQPKVKAEGDRNVNSESYIFSLIGTRPLVISSVGPNGTIKDSTDSVKVTLTVRTTAGYSDGLAYCYYSDTGEEDSYIQFFESNSYKHAQDLYLSAGVYNYSIKCLDLGGNSDLDSIGFTVDTDTDAPIIVRAYHEENYLKLITHEKGKCVYDPTNCNYLFTDGLSLTVIDGVNHFTDWNTEVNFHVKCEDEFGNKPAPDVCSIIVRPGEDLVKNE